ncbi:MAG: GDSL-type esterase/lipase family protein [Roseiarcus sp.]|jgi:acyl-CoA thioesterase-1
MRWLGLALVVALFGAAAAKAQVVALGDSSTRGYLLPISDAWPAKLEALLRQRGLNVSVANEGINGDTSEGMLGRLDSAVPEGTRVVIFGCCGNDNKDKNHKVFDHEGNIRTIISRLRARGIAVVFSSNSGPSDAATAQNAGAPLCGGMYQGVPPEELEDSKAGRHPTPKGHDIIAARMLPCVMRALGRKS